MIERKIIEVDLIPL